MAPGGWLLARSAYRHAMFSLTERQATALANMEAHLGIRDPRTDFADREAFQAYWDLVSRRCDTTTRARARETPASRQEQRERRAERIAAYYQDADHLLAYGREYAARYQPSTAKLRQQLVAKSGSVELGEQVMGLLAERLQDDVRAMELAEAMQRQGRHAQAIRAKLRQRLFSTAVIDRCLQAMSASTGSVLEADAVARKVQQLQRKGLSQRAMRSKLMGSAADGAVVSAAMAETLGAQGDDGALRTAIARLARKQLDKRALTQRLMAKGFRYADIAKALAETAAGPS